MTVVDTAGLGEKLKAGILDFVTKKNGVLVCRGWGWRPRDNSKTQRLQRMHVHDLLLYDAGRVPDELKEKKCGCALSASIPSGTYLDLGVVNEATGRAEDDAFYHVFGKIYGLLPEDAKDLVRGFDDVGGDHQGTLHYKLGAELRAWALETVGLLIIEGGTARWLPPGSKDPGDLILGDDGELDEAEEYDDHESETETT